MNRPEYIVIHHSLTNDNIVLSDFEAIRRYHIETKGWKDIGYHWVLERVSGNWVWCAGRKETDVGAHCKQQGMNYKSLGICVVGNFDKDIPPAEVYFLVAEKCRELMSRWPKIKVENIVPHSKYAPKTCPGRNFDMDLLRSIVTRDGWMEIRIPIGKGEMYVDGKKIKLDVPAKIENGRTLVPVRAIAEAFGCIVSYDDKTKTVSILKKKGA